MTKTTTSKKLTKRDHFNALLAIADVQANPQLVEFITHELELLDKKNSADKKPTATQIANDGFKTAIFAVMSAEPTRLFTVTELLKTVPEIAELTNQRASAIIRQMTEAGTLERVEEKRKAYFRIPQ